MFFTTSPTAKFENKNYKSKSSQWPIMDYKIVFYLIAGNNLKPKYKQYLTNSN